MAINKTNKTDIRQIFEFASGENSFDCIDMTSNRVEMNSFKFLMSSGSFVYRTRLVVDDKKASLLGVTGLRMEFFDTDAEKYNVTDANLIGHHDLVFETQNLIEKDIATINKNKKITAKVLSNSAMKVYAANIAATSNLDKTSLPISASPFQKPSLKSASDVAIAKGQDPALLSSRGYPFTQTAEWASSLESRIEKSFDFDFPDSKEIDPATSEKISLRNLRRELRRRKRSSYDDNDIVKSHIPFSFPDSKSGNVPIKTFDLIPAKRLVQRDIHLPKNKCNISKIFVRVSAITTKKKGVTQKSFSSVHEEINHSSQIARLLRYPEPPEVEIESVDFSKVVFRLTKTDPTLAAVRVVKIVQNPSMPEPRVENAGIYKFLDENVIRIEQQSDNLKPNHITYRFCAVVSDDTVSEFASVVVPTFKKGIDPIDNISVPFSILALNLVGAVVVKVRVLSPDVQSFRLLRQEIGKSGDFSDSVVTIRNKDDHYETIVEEDSDIFSPAQFLFTDRSAELGHKYRYFLAYRTGKISKHANLSFEKISDEEDVIVHRRLVEEIPFTITMNASPVTLDAEGEPSVTITTTATEKEELFSTVVDALTSAGVSGEFISNIQANSIKAKEFIMFLVERFDTVTGRKESFGLRPPGEFTDNSSERQKRGIEDLIPGRSYEYILKVCVQDPVVFFQKTNVSIVNRLGNLIPREASRFTRKIRESLGVFPSEAEVREGLTIEQLILESQVGAEFNTVVDYTAGTLQITDPVVTKSKEYTDINWSLVGQKTDRVSYFNVFCTLQGEKNLIGSISAHPDASGYKFRDDTYDKAVGTKSYSVTAISYFHDEILSSKPAKKDKLFSIPENMLVGAIFGSFGSKKKIAPIGPSKAGHEALAPTDMSTPPGIPGTPHTNVEIGNINFDPGAVSSLDDAFSTVNTFDYPSVSSVQDLPIHQVTSPLLFSNASSLIGHLDPSDQNRFSAVSFSQPLSQPRSAGQASSQPRAFDPANQMPDQASSSPTGQASQNETEENNGSVAVYPIFGGFSF